MKRKPSNYILRGANAVCILVIVVLFMLCAYAVLDAWLANGESSSKRYEVHETLDEAYRAAKAANDEVIGWVKLNDSGLSQPIVQGEDNSFYLTHDYTKNASAGGAAFLDAACNSNMNEGVPIVYGHNMEANAMFGAIKYFEDSNYMQTHTKGCLCIHDVWHSLDVCSLIQCGENERVLYACRDDSNVQMFLDAAEGFTIQLVKKCYPYENLLGLSTCVENGNKRNILLVSIGDANPALGKNTVY